MKEYFIHNGQQQIGPFSFEELRHKGINTKTMVWYEGLSEWSEAGKLEELNEIISKSPPVFSKARTIPPPLEKAKKILNTDYVDEIENKIKNQSGKKAFKIGLILFAIIGLIVVIIQVLPSQERKEKNHPTDFLTVTDPTGRFSGGYYGERGNRFAISGKLTNSAVKTQYKDFKVEVQFFTQTHTQLGSNKQYTIYDDINPSTTKDISKIIDEQAPEGTAEVRWRIVNATGVTLAQ